jgi:DNA-binding transcriptional MerR regulator
MSDQSDHNAPHDTAASLGIQPATLRRWCAYHAAHLSSGANPPAGQARRFDGRDLEVLRTVRALRAQGLTVTAINDQLANMTFAVIDTEQEEPDTGKDVPQLPATTAPNAADSTPGMIVPQDYLAAIERRFEALEQAKVNDRRLVRDGVFMFMAGVCVALVLVLIVLVALQVWVK